MISCSETQIQSAFYDWKIAEAREMGADHGRAAASWYFDGNTSTETYRAVFQGIEDGDPAVYDTFPCSPLSGEWADDPTPASVFAALGLPQDSEAEEVLYAYEDGFSTAVHDSIESTARAMLSQEVN